MIFGQPIYRGHGFSEGDATGGYGTPAYTVDVLNAVSSMKRYAAADPTRIGIWGHSMDGQITLRAMVVTGDIKAGVNHAFHNDTGQRYVEEQATQAWTDALAWFAEYV